MQRLFNSSFELFFPFKTKNQTEPNYLELVWFTSVRICPKIESNQTKPNHEHPYYETWEDNKVVNC